MKTELNLHGRSLTLHRFPKRSNETLQAWDAGDEYLINHVEEMALPDHQTSLLSMTTLVPSLAGFLKNIMSLL